MGLGKYLKVFAAQAKPLDIIKLHLNESRFIRIIYIFSAFTTASIFMTSSVRLTNHWILRTDRNRFDKHQEFEEFGNWEIRGIVHLILSWFIDSSSVLRSAHKLTLLRRLESRGAIKVFKVSLRSSKLSSALFIEKQLSLVINIVFAPRWQYLWFSKSKILLN